MLFSCHSLTKTVLFFTEDVYYWGVVKVEPVLVHYYEEIMVPLVLPLFCHYFATSIGHQHSIHDSTDKDWELNKPEVSCYILSL